MASSRARACFINQGHQGHLARHRPCHLHGRHWSSRARTRGEPWDVGARRTVHAAGRFLHCCHERLAVRALKALLWRWEVRMPDWPSTSADLHAPDGLFHRALLPQQLYCRVLMGDGLGIRCVWCQQRQQLRWPTLRLCPKSHRLKPLRQSGQSYHGIAAEAPTWPRHPTSCFDEDRNYLVFIFHPRRIYSRLKCVHCFEQFTAKQRLSSS